MRRRRAADGRWLLRLAAATVATGVALLLGATPALAHTRLQGSSPAAGASVATGPDTVSLTFNEDVQADFAKLTVVGPDGTEYQSGSVSAGGGQVSTAVSPLGPAGAYRIGYRVVSDDGHPVQGTVSFTLTAPGPAVGVSAPVTEAAPVVAAADPPTAPAPAEGAPVWPWLAGAAILVAAGAGVALGPGRRSR